MKKKVLVVVAHPDDEILWMGGELIRHKKDWDTKLVVLCRKSDKDREPKFRKVCKEINVKGHIFDLEDKKLKSLSMEDYISKIKKFGGKYDLIYTHGLNGEYGHIRHIEIHKAVNEMIKKGDLKSKKVLFFSYHKVRNKYQGYATHNPNADIFIKLNNHEFSMKKHLAINVYGYERGGMGFEENSCKSIEAFDVLKK